MLCHSCPARQSIGLKEGSQVVLIKNMDPERGLLNGTRGIVTRFSKHLGLPVVRFLNGMEVTIGREQWQIKVGGGSKTASRSQIPLDLAWALSIHKSQGMSLDLVQVSLSKSFEAGQAYVALSRAKSLHGLKVLDFKPECIFANPKAVEWCKNNLRNVNELTSQTCGVNCGV